MCTLLDHEHTAFVLVDVQGKLAETVHNSEEVLNQLEILIKGLKILDIPIIWLEQYPQGLGRTHERIARLLSDLEPIEKTAFNACENEEFMHAIEATDCQQILVAGMETHICAYQTAMGLKQVEYDVQIIEDATSSRTENNKSIGLEKLKAHGIFSTSVEMVLYELMHRAEGEHFKEILKLVK
ncbi:isochorismatase family protein [Sporosarcina sp. CAU 1771]